MLSKTSIFRNHCVTFSNNNGRGLLMPGATEYSAGLQYNQASIENNLLSF
jgi:hypothetical protein